MITITVLKQNSTIKQVIFKGHANYADYGKDIVCAGVSAIMSTTINAILKFKKQIEVIDEDDLVITVLENDNIVDTLLNNMLELLQELERQYKKNISIRMEDYK